jgi:tRNA A37 threonylcarbamoyladenosine synthetase subunit TsaC/SUA5/YrdC
MPSPQVLSDVMVLDSDVALKFDSGKLRKGLVSTVIEADETGVRVLRIGAVSLEEIQKIVPGATSA